MIPKFVGLEGIRRYKAKRRYIVLDFETTILPGFATNPDNHIVLACWSICEGDAVLQKKWRFADEYDMAELLDDIKSADFVVAHNAKFECQWLERAGQNLRSLLVYCTQNGEWIIHGNNPKHLSFHLDDIAERRLGRHKDKLGSDLIRIWGVCPSVTPRSWLLHYCQLDVELTRLIFLQQCEEIEALGLWHIALTRNLVVPVLADIEMAGLQLDAEAVEAEYQKQNGIAEAAAEALDSITGGINLNSRPQVARLLYDKLGFQEVLDFKGNPIRTEGGKPATSEDVILKLEARTDDQRLFLERYKEYVKATSLLSKTLTYLRLVCQQRGGVFFGNIAQGRTGTHRLASTGVDTEFDNDGGRIRRLQLQNIPREYKKLFTAHDEDYLVDEKDGAQLEFRVAAELGNEPVALKEIEDGVDIHVFTRQVMRGANHPDFIGLDDKAARQEAKPHTFQPLYGGRGQLPAENAYADAWAKKYATLTKEQETWCLEVVANKCLVTRYGMRYYWPFAKLHRNGRTNVRNEVFNYPIQGFATAEIIPIALVYFWYRTANLRLRIFNTVHDSIISRVHKDDVEELNAISKVAFTEDVYNYLKVVYNYQMTVPLGVGSKTSKHWGTAKKELVWDVWPDGRERFQEKD